MSAPDLVVGTYDTPDGAHYHGTLRDGLPDGLGTCMWPNGSTYDGEWRAGQMQGFGTYVWKSGQRFDGEWKDGKRDGVGIKTYADGSMYDGFWKDGKKHGLGVFRPQCNLRQAASSRWPPRPSGGGGTTALPGCASGGRVASEVTGAAASEVGVSAAPVEPAPEAAGSVSDGGTTAADADALDTTGDSMVDALASGEGLDGSGTSAGPPWQQAMAVSPTADPVSPGPFAAQSLLLASDSSLMMSPPAPRDRDMVPGTASAGAGHFAGGGASGGGGGAGQPQLLIREYTAGGLVREDALNAEEIRMIFGFLWPKQRDKATQRLRRVLGRRQPRLQQTKLGEVVYKGHYSYQLMLELQLGIRYSVGRGLGPVRVADASARAWTSAGGGGGALASASAVSCSPNRPLTPGDFREAIKVTFPSCGSSKTPAHPSIDFRWKDFSPHVFRRLRSVAHIDEADYMLSLAGSQALRQLNSPGKSGSVFFLSEDERFLVKTMRKGEMKVLLSMLPAYYEHMTAHPNSLITRFFGLHRITPLHGRKVRFVVMANIFVTDLQIHRRYDIKGSTDGRTAGVSPKQGGDVSGVIFKDLDLDVTLQLPDQASHDALMKQLRADTELLKGCGVMDYSLLMGIHYPARVAGGLPFSASIAYKAYFDRTTSLSFSDATGGPLPRTSGPQHDVFAEQRGLASDSDGDAAAPLPPMGPAARLLGAGGAPLRGALGHGERRTSDDAGGGGGTGDRARNFDVYSNAVELEARLAAIAERMAALNFPEQRIKDITELARLKMLGSKLKRRQGRREPPSAVLQAMQQQRQDGAALPSGALLPAADTSGAVLPGSVLSAGGGPPGVPRSLSPLRPPPAHLASLRGAFAGLGASYGDDEDDGQDTPLGAAQITEHGGPPGLGPAAHSSGPAPQLGINMAATAFPRDESEARGEEVVVSFGIIDILQDYSARKVLERQLKGLSHDRAAISVAPPRIYGDRFLDFITRNLFKRPPLPPATVLASPLLASPGAWSPPLASAAAGARSPGVVAAPAHAVSAAASATGGAGGTAAAPAATAALVPSAPAPAAVVMLPAAVDSPPEEKQCADAADVSLQVIKAVQRKLVSGSNGGGNATSHGSHSPLMVISEAPIIAAATS